MAIAPVVPNPRTFPVTLAEFSFSEPVTGLDVADFTLTRNGTMVNLVGLGATISSFSPQQFGLDLTTWMASISSR
jgi:hypothetical protein